MSHTRSFESESGAERLDRFLAGRCPDLSRSRLQRLIADGHVTVDGLPAKPAARLRAGQHVSVTVAEPAPSELAPQPIPLTVVYEDRDVLVVDKPAGMTVHPAAGHPDQTLANAVLAHVPEISGVGSALRPGIVHRLDKDTSGLIVVAKSAEAHTRLAAQFAARRVSKLYLALVHGQVSPAEAVIEAPIGRHPRDRKRMAVLSAGRESTTRYKVLQQYRRYALLEVRPTTGRTHQVRVHLASVGHPLAGDATYGKPHTRLERHFLHAHRLGFRLPSGDRYVEFVSELPPELQDFLDSLKH
jgi:23S rRNA pseudouridine1911/1915/1917 synthase